MNLIIYFKTYYLQLILHISNAQEDFNDKWIILEEEHEIEKIVANLSKHKDAITDRRNSLYEKVDPASANPEGSFDNLEIWKFGTNHLSKSINTIMK